MYGAIGWIDKYENILAAGETSTPYMVNLDTTMYADVAPGTLRPETRTCIMNLSLLISYMESLRILTFSSKHTRLNLWATLKSAPPIGRKGLISSLKTASYAKKSKQIAV